MRSRMEKTAYHSNSTFNSITLPINTPLCSNIDFKFLRIENGLEECYHSAL